jgi:signal transduction histidine kinase
MSTPQNPEQSHLDETNYLNSLNLYLRKTKQLTQQSVDNALATICHAVAEILDSHRAVLFIHNQADASLELVSSFPVDSYRPDIFLNTYSVDENTMIGALIQGDIVSLDGKQFDETTANLAQFVKVPASFVPLHLNGNLTGALLIFADGTPHTPPQAATLSMLSEHIADDLDTVLHHSVTNDELLKLQEETEIFQQIDTELSDVIELNYVFTMILDWALRFTNAEAAGLSLYNRDTGSLRAVINYGYRPNIIKRGEEIPAHRAGIALRVAKTGLAEIVPDVSVDRDYFSVADGIRTHMSIPIARDDTVIAVLSLESREFNGFSDEHLEFVRKLTNRAGVALDNARLFAETEREREKLSYILKNIADGVIAVSADNNIVLMNSSAILAFSLATDVRYEGQPFADVVIHSKLQSLLTEAMETGEDITGEITLTNNKIYYVTVNYYPEVGYIIVLQDITHFKEVDKLKTELVATVSHDLKQPLASMRGYLDLLQLTDSINPSATPYVEKIEIGFSNMRQLIDDLLDIAQIESGLSLKRDVVDLVDLLEDAVNSLELTAQHKAIKMTLDVPSGLPTIMGDKARLIQIFNNLVSNAVKYTQPEGHVKIYSEVKQNLVRIYIEDDGMGIGPEDLSQIFERFYRVRRPETDSIDGTGLGLAIVKSLIEAHQGKIDVKSELGVGSVFRVTLPTE